MRITATTAMIVTVNHLLPTRPRPSRLLFTFTSLVTVGLTACGSDSGGGDAERFCGAVDENKVTLTSPQLEFSDDIEPFIEMYRSIGELAPLAIEPEWNQLVANYETVSTIVPGDTESEQAAVLSALQSEEAAATVSRWLSDNCAVDIGPLSTLVAHDG